jgi:hypothetical protein
LREAIAAAMCLEIAYNLLLTAVPWWSSSKGDTFAADLIIS